MTTEYITPKTDWHPTNEEGISTADLNRIEKNIKHLKEDHPYQTFFLSGKQSGAEQTLNPPLRHPYYITIPVGYKLILFALDYNIFQVGGSASLCINLGEIGGDVDAYYNNTDTEFAGLLDITIAENSTEEPLSSFLQVQISEGWGGAWFFRLQLREI